MNIQPKKPNMLTIPVSQAEQLTHNWRGIIENLKKRHIDLFHDVRAFNMTLSEIHSAIDPGNLGPGGGPVSARIYLGCTSETPSSDADFKLMIVGVDKNGKDILTNIGDFSNPCPTFCDPTSPLNSDTRNTNSDSNE
jgi:hypothetical protein